MKRARKPAKKKAVAYRLTEIAAAIQNHFKIVCSKQGIKNWQKWEPPFPIPDAGGRYDKQECFDWVKKYYLPKHKKGEQQTDLFVRAAQAKAREQIRDDEQSAFDFEVKKGRYVDRTRAKLTIMGVLKKYHAMVRNELERNCTSQRKEKLIRLGAPVELVNAFYEFDIALAMASVDRIEVECANAGKTEVKVESGS